MTQKVDPQPQEIVEIFFINDGRLLHDDNPSYLGYVTGQYVRVCRWEKDRRWAYDFNLITLATGRFDTRYSLKRVEWHEDPKRLLSN